MPLSACGTQALIFCISSLERKRCVACTESSDLSLPHIADIANAYGLKTVTIRNNAELAEKVREAYEGSIEYRLGCQIMDGLTQGYALTSDDAEAMLTGEYAPKSSEIVGARAAETLKRMGKEGRLARGIESYLSDGEFLQMLRQMPAELAIRIKEAEWAAEGAKNARSDGERDAIEKLKARQALPTPMRTIIPVSAEPDFSTMSSEEFARFKRRRFGQ